MSLSSATYARFIVAVLLLASRLSVIQAQEIGVGSLDHDRITAGQTFQLTVTFPTAPTYQGYAVVLFDYKPVNGIVPPQSPIEFGCRGDTRLASREVVLSCSVPIDTDGGTYEVRNPLQLGPPPGATRIKYVKVKVPDIDVMPVQDTNVYPTTAAGTISLDQQQILQSGAAKIEVLLDQLNTRVDHSAAETSDLKVYLSKLAKTSQGELEKSRSAFRATLPKDAPEPIFFEDFDRQYAALIVEINAPQNTGIEMHPTGVPRLQMIQLSTNQTVTVRPPQFGGSLGPLVSKLAELMGDHVAAFLRVADSKSTSFTISLRSTPPGASISYKRIGESYQDYSTPTDVDQATFPYALWTFRFTMGHCEVVKHPNPYIEKSPNLNAVMQNCPKK